ncbi:hypothetical protein HMPREF9401_2338 [Aliarcobacter butzleri JV22]|uniref:hypothetical protein n=1 Tax=Aliarcobacter butzleri TaxID=28197 RepID=UPI0001F12643|nr:hypothetical protein [Aliarcobacter butzleri]EFU68733.1 hypothetical protein HMPREF9401_2338 [Aliarcobacter butzleri JV22]
MSYKKHFLTTYLLLSLNLFADGYEECSKLDKLNHNSIIQKEIIINCNDNIHKTSKDTSFDLEIKLINQKISIVENKVNDKLNDFEKNISQQYNIMDWWLKLTSLIVTIAAGLLIFLGFKTKKDITDDIISRTESKINIKMDNIRSETNVNISEIKSQLLQQDFRSFDNIRVDILKNIDETIINRFEAYDIMINEFQTKLEEIQNNKNTPMGNVDKSKHDDPFE